MLDIRVSIIPMDGQTRGLTIKLINSYLILINEALCDRARWRTYEHEVRHIVDEDFDYERQPDELQGD